MVQSEIWFWGSILIILFPLIMIVLIEAHNRIEKVSKNIARLIDLTRLILLPSIALLICVEHFLKIPDTHLSVRLISTFIGLTAGYLTISLVNNILVSTKTKHAWQLQVPSLMFQVTRVLLILGFLAYIMASIWEFDLSRVFAALGVGSLVVALALQDTLSNLVSGFLLLVEQPFQVGDWLRVGDKEGEVIEMNWRAVRLKTRDRDVIIIPNGVLGGSTICNYTMVDPLHAEKTIVRFSYENPPNEVKQILRHVAFNTEGILQDPPPDVRTMEYGDFYIAYKIKFYVLDFTKVDKLKNKLLTNIYYAAKRNYLTIPFPTQIESKIDKINHFPEPSRNEVVSLLKKISYFGFLPPENLSKLTDNLSYQFYGVGEVILYEEEYNPEVYIIYSGEVELTATDTSDKAQIVTQLGTGDLFGVMSVSSQNNRNLTKVTATQDLQVLVIDAEIITEFLYQNPRFAIAINDFVNERRNLISLATNTLVQEENINDLDSQAISSS